MPENATQRLKYKKKRKLKESQNRIRLMIILNGLNYFLLRTPLLIVGFYGYIYRLNLNNNVIKEFLPSRFLYLIFSKLTLMY